MITRVSKTRQISVIERHQKNMKMRFNLLALGLSFGMASAAQANLILTSDSPLKPPDESPASLEAFVGAKLGNPNLIDALR